MKHLNDPDRYVTKLFELVDDSYKKTGGNLRPVVLPKSRLLLGAPTKGQPQSQILSPIRLPKESSTTLEARELARVPEKQFMKIKQFYGVENLTPTEINVPIKKSLDLRGNELVRLGIRTPKKLKISK